MELSLNATAILVSFNEEVTQAQQLKRLEIFTSYII